MKTYSSTGKQVLDLRHNSLVRFVLLMNKRRHNLGRQRRSSFDKEQSNHLEIFQQERQFPENMSCDSRQHLQHKKIHIC